MAVTSSGIQATQLGPFGWAAGNGEGNKGVGEPNRQPKAEQEWWRKWRPLSGRIPAERKGVLRWQRRFTGAPEQVGAARRFVQFLLTDSAVASDAAWVTGELATNAIRHGGSGKDGETFTVEVLRWRHHVQVQVIDAGGDGRPVLPSIDPAIAVSEGGEPPESGLGLYGVSALACRFGTYQYQDGSRVVWVRLKADPPRVVGAGG